MKSIITICLLLIGFKVKLLAQAPMAFKYQAVARDANGAMIINKNINVRVGIRDLTIAGTVVFQESHAVTTNSFGIININIGTGTLNQGSFSGINWGSGNKFIEVEIDLGNGFVSIGTSQLLSVPYALYAANGPQGPQGIPGANGLQGIQGPQGLQGNPGTNGISIIWLGTFNTPPISPTVNNAYYDSTKKKSFVWNGSSWQILAQDGNTGPIGPKGSSYLSVFQYVTTALDDVADSTDMVVYNCNSWVVLPFANAVPKGKMVVFVMEKMAAGNTGPLYNMYVAARGSDHIINGFTPMGYNAGEVDLIGASYAYNQHIYVSDGASKWYMISQ